MKNNHTILSLMAALLLCPTAASAREQIRVVGSSTVFPFAAAAAEQFSHGSHFRTPIVESTGTGGGFKVFCAGVGDGFPDIATASRPIKDSERKQCAAHSVGEVSEFSLGYDGIVFASAQQAPALALTKRSIFLAIAKHVPQNGALVPNPYHSWRAVDAALPEMPIAVDGPPSIEGTREALVELVMLDACKSFPEFAAAYPDEKIRKEHCAAVREDGTFVDLLGGNLMVQKLMNNPQAVGIFGYSFLQQNTAVIKAHAVDRVMPSAQAITDGTYPLARSLYLYVKNAHVTAVPGLKDFVMEMLSDAASGEDGYLVLKGLMPLPDAEHVAMQKRAAELE